MPRRKAKRSAKVYVLPGVERRDMTGEPLPSAEILQAAINSGIRDAVVVGYDRRGCLYVASAGSDVDKTCGMVMRAIRLLTCNVE